MKLTKRYAGLTNGNIELPMGGEVKLEQLPETQQRQLSVLLLAAEQRGDTMPNRTREIEGIGRLTYTGMGYVWIAQFAEE